MIAVPRPGTFAWLVMHEMRVTWRSAQRASRARWVGIALLAVYLVFGIFTAFGLRNTPIVPSLEIDVGIAAGSVAVLSFMLTQAMLASQRTLYESGDLDLLLTAPIAPRTVLLAKLVGIAAMIASTFALLTMPMVAPIAILGHPRLFGVIALLIALALTAAAIGLAVTLALARTAGPRAARTVGQIAAAVMAGAVFLVTQLGDNGGYHRSSYRAIFDWMRANHLGGSGWSAWPGQAAFGDSGPMVGLLATGMALFALTGVAFQRAFVGGYQDAGMRVSRRRPARSDPARLFHAGLFRSVFAKEFRLLLRDPAILFRIVLRLIYLTPILIFAFRDNGGLPIAPVLAAMSTVISGQLAGSFAWLAVAAEDAPDLIAVAPIAKREVDRAKLTAALAMAAPLALLLPIAIVPQSPIAALIALAMTALGGWVAGVIELKLGKPGKRSTFARRSQGSFVVGILALIATGALGVIAAIGAYLVG